MFKVKEIFRLYFEIGLSYSQISESISISKGSVFNYLKAFKEAGLSWPSAKELSDEDLQKSINVSRQEDACCNEPSKSLPDFKLISEELAKPHTTIFLLWEEYRQENPDGLGKSAFYDRFRKHKETGKLEMHINHKAGEKLFIDYSGDGLEFYDKVTNSIKKVELFVCTWGLSNYSFVDATLSQKIPDWISSHVRAFKYFGCIPHLLVPDNLKSGVTKANFYEPEINSTYKLLSEFYDTAVLPARVRKPKDKATVEAAVKHVQHYILGRLRNYKFFSLNEINEKLQELLEEFNTKSMQRSDQSRKERFDHMDKKYAKPLPLDDFSIDLYERNLTVNKDYHVLVNKHYYSVPYTARRNSKGKVDVAVHGGLLEFFQKGGRITSHLKGPSDYTYTTTIDHMPKNHQFYARLTPDNIYEKAKSIGPKMAQVAVKHLYEGVHPEVGIRMLLGIFKLEKTYNAFRLENAAKRALFFNRINLSDFASILELSLDKEPIENKEANKDVDNIIHENIRGPENYEQFTN